MEKIKTLKLPVMTGMERGILQGRNFYEGYQRGWRLQFHGLREEVSADLLYQEMLAAASDHTIMSEENRMNIYLLLRFFLGKTPFGHIFEHGSYRGGSAVFMAYITQKLYQSMKFFALDSLEGVLHTDKNPDAYSKHLIKVSGR